MWIQKITTAMEVAKTFFKPRNKSFGFVIDKKNGDNHIVVKALYSEGTPLDDNHLTYLK